jgi:hypothetical protein
MTKYDRPRKPWGKSDRQRAATPWLATIAAVLASLLAALLIRHYF